MIEALLLDCDGVIRHWDVDAFSALAERSGCDAVALAAIAFDPDLMGEAMVGRLTADAWAEEIGLRTAAAHGATAAHVAHEFLQLGWRIDDSVVDIARRVRAAGRRVAILSNATTRLEADLATSAVDVEVDVIFSSARLGLAKPDPAIYLLAAEALGLEPAACLFIDDQAPNVQAARGVGMAAEVFMGAGPLAVLVERVGLLAG